MTQRTRNIIATSLLVASILFIAAFVAQHFMTPPRPSWHSDLPWLAVAFATAARLARGRPRRSAMQSAD
jgi:hypothetical protein